MTFRPKQSARKYPAAALSAIVVLGATLLAFSAEQQPQVLVVSALGDWRQIPPNAASGLQKPVAFGQRLDVTLGCLYGVVDSSIVLKYATPSDNTLYPFPCEKPPSAPNPDCKSGPAATCPIDLKKLANKKGIISGFASDLSDTFARLLTSRPDRYMFASSRGLEAELNDAVVPFDGDGAELSSVFRGMPPGNYYVEFVMADARASHSAPVTVTIAKNQKAFAAAPSLHPGLYKLLLVDQQGEPAGSDAWIVLAPAGNYSAKAAAFQKVVDESAKLPPEMDPAATRALLRVYLESLAVPGKTERQ